MIIIQEEKKQQLTEDSMMWEKLQEWAQVYADNHKPAGSGFALIDKGGKTRIDWGGTFRVLKSGMLSIVIESLLKGLRFEIDRGSVKSMIVGTNGSITLDLQSGSTIIIFAYM